MNLVLTLWEIKFSEDVVGKKVLFVYFFHKIVSRTKNPMIAQLTTSTTTRLFCPSPQDLANSTGYELIGWRQMREDGYGTEFLWDNGPPMSWES